MGQYFHGLARSLRLLVFSWASGEVVQVQFGLVNWTAAVPPGTASKLNSEAEAAIGYIQTQRSR